MLGPVGIRRLLMVIALVAYGFALLPEYGFVVCALTFDVFAAWLFLFLPKLEVLARGKPEGDPTEEPPVIPMADEVIYVVCVGLAFFLWPAAFGLPDDFVLFIAAVVVATAILTVGIVATLLPYDPYAAFRPPWTRADEDTWFVTNRLLGYGSCPVAIAYVACFPSFSTIIGFWLLTLVIIVCWLGVPAILSWYYHRRHIPLE